MERCPSTKVLDAIPYFRRAVKMERRSEVESMFSHIRGDGDEVFERLGTSPLRYKAGLCVGRHREVRSLSCSAHVVNSHGSACAILC